MDENLSMLKWCVMLVQCSEVTTSGAVGDGPADTDLFLSSLLLLSSWLLLKTGLSLLLPKIVTML